MFGQAPTVRAVPRPAVNLLGALAALIAALIFSTTAGLVPATRAASPAPRIVIIVGPTHSATTEYLQWGSDLATYAGSLGMQVTRVFHPRATWTNVVSAATGANVVVYFGHGNGWPSPYGPFQETTKNGFGLNEVEGGSQNTVKYYGGDKVRQSIVLAPNSVVLFNRLCYAEGNGESGMAIPTLSVATQRVDNYAAAFLSPTVGARAVFAFGWQRLNDVLNGLMTTDKTIDQIFMTPNGTRGWTGWNDTYFDSVRTAGKRGHLDPYSDKGFLRAVSGDLGMKASTFRGGDVPVPDDTTPPTLTDVAAREDASTTAPSTSGARVFTPNADLVSDSLYVNFTASEDVTVDVTVMDELGGTVRAFSRAMPQGAGSVSWNGKDDTSATVPNGRYTITLTPRDGAGNLGTPGTVMAKVMTTMRSPAVTPKNFYAADGDALAPTTTMSVNLAQPASVSWAVVNEAGDTVRTFATDEQMATGAQSRVWDGRDDSGAMAPDGRYYSLVTTTTDAGTYSHRVSLYAAAFEVTYTGTMARGQRVVFTIKTAERLSANPNLKITQPGLTMYKVYTTKVSATKYRATVTLRTGGPAGPMTVLTTGTDTGGLKQSTSLVLQLD